jgi:hypothetical protein
VPGVQVLSGTGGAAWADLATSGTHVYAAWAEKGPGGSAVHFRRSTDEGASWTPAQRLSGLAEPAGFLRMAVSGSRVYVVWSAQGTAPGTVQTWMRASTDGGATFGPTLAVPLPSLKVVAAEGESLYVVTESKAAYDHSEAADILFTASHDGGRTWAPVQDVNGTDYGGLQVLARGDRVYLLWGTAGSSTDDIPRFRESADRGATFGPVVRLAGDDDNVDTDLLVLQGDRLHFVWSHCTGHHLTETCHVSLRTQPGPGQPFGPARVLSETAVRAVTPDVAVDGAALHVVWTEGPNTRENLVYRRSLDAGDTFLPAETLTLTPRQRLWPSITAGGGSVSFTWWLDRALYFREARALGAEFGEPERVSAGVEAEWQEAGTTPHHVHALFLEGPWSLRQLKYLRR